MPQQSILAISYFFHMVATVVWIGGLAIMVLLMWPEARRALGTNPALNVYLTRLRRRFMPLTNLSLAVLIFTGLIQMSGNPQYDGLLQINNDWARAILFKHLAVGGMLLCGLAMQFWVIPALERAALLAEHGRSDNVKADQFRRTEIRLTWLSLLLGILVLGFTAWARALG